MERNKDKLKKHELAKIGGIAVRIADVWMRQMVKGCFDGLTREDLEQLRKEAGIS